MAAANETRRARAHADQRRSGCPTPGSPWHCWLTSLGPPLESGLHRQSWRNLGVGDDRWLRFLVSCGYTLAEIERQIVDAAEQPTADPSSDVI
jgi:hypothetical protein